MKKVLFFVIYLLFCLGAVYAQTESRISHYTFFPAAYNPAMAGETGMIQLVGTHRINLMTLDGGQVTNLGLNAPVSIGSVSNGVGLRFVNRSIGTMRSMQQAYLQYAFKKNTSIGKFSLGVDVGFYNIKIDGGKARFVESDYHKPTDPVIPTTEVSGMGLDLNLGALYDFEKGYVGLSFIHLNSAKIEIDTKTTETLKPVMYLVGSYKYAIPDTKLKLLPSALLATNFGWSEWNVGSRLEYNEKIWGGLAYQYRNHVVFSAGANAIGGISVGVAYELPASSLIVGTLGSFELVVEFNFEYVLNKHTKKYKSVRIL